MRKVVAVAVYVVFVFLHFAEMTISRSKTKVLPDLAIAI